MSAISLIAKQFNFCLTIHFQVEGTVSDKNKQPKIFLSGTWDSKIESYPILKVDSKGNFTLGPAKLLWIRTMPP